MCRALPFRQRRYFVAVVDFRAVRILCRLDHGTLGYTWAAHLRDFRFANFEVNVGRCSRSASIRSRIAWASTHRPLHSSGGASRANKILTGYMA